MATKEKAKSKAAKAKKKLRKNLILPAGEASYPHLSNADTQGKYATGKYDCTVRYTGETAEQVKKMLDEAVAELLPDAEDVKSLYRDDKDTEGAILVKAKSAKQPPVFDTKNTKVPATPLRIGGGSIVKMAVTVNVYDEEEEKVNLWLNAVQVIKLEQYGGGASFDKEEVEDGFDASGMEFEEQDNDEPKKEGSYEF